MRHKAVVVGGGEELRPCLVQKNFEKFFRFPSHQIFKRMHEVLNIDENKY